MIAYKILFFSLTVSVVGQYDHPFEDITNRIHRITKGNCRDKDVEDLHLPVETVSHLPDLRDLYIEPLFPNRTQLIHLQNVAINRAIFWSYILQNRFMKLNVSETYDPGMLYYLLSTVADVSSNKDVNASAIYFSPNTAYSSSYSDFFNKTFARFAPRTYRNTDLTFNVNDLGAIKTETSQDYASHLNPINDWYRKWLPDKLIKNYDRKTSYLVDVQYANNTNQSFTFYGPPAIDDIPLPVEWTRPYFDCERSNQWLVAAVVPIVDVYPRHTGDKAVEQPTYTAISVVETNFENIDINQCPFGIGNKGPNMFAGTAKCKTETTKCEPIDGWGFRKGGYQCSCIPGYRRPLGYKIPFSGEEIEASSPNQYNNGFECQQIKSIQSLPIFWEKAEPTEIEKVLDQYPEYRNEIHGPDSIRQPVININRVLDYIFSVNKTTCKNFKPEDLTLPKSVSYGAETFFENEANLALRVANFVSAFLQIINPKEKYLDNRVPDVELNEDQIIGEISALLLGNQRIWSAAIYWDKNKFLDRTLFAPYAYRKYLFTRRIFVEDLARPDSSSKPYLDHQWFKDIKQRWSNSFDSLETFVINMRIRSAENAESTMQFDHFPTNYSGARLEHGLWTEPYYDCNGKVPRWKIKYLAPFFGWDSLKTKLEFKGAVAVTMDLLLLDINQCPGDPENAFQGTDKCDHKSSHCVPILGRGFDTGGYKCECDEGFEYPFEDQITYYDGQLIEAEFSRLVENKETRFNIFKCRLVGANNTETN